MIGIVSTVRCESLGKQGTAVEIQKDLDRPADVLLGCNSSPIIPWPRLHSQTTYIVLLGALSCDIAQNQKEKSYFLKSAIIGYDCRFS